MAAQGQPGAETAPDTTTPDAPEGAPPKRPPPRVSPVGWIACMTGWIRWRVSSARCWRASSVR
jgi:hypothetical protein